MDMTLLSDEEAITELTAIMREADLKFETVGGSTRHYVRDLLLPMLQEKGLCFCRLSPLSDTQPDPLSPEEYAAEMDKFMRGERKEPPAWTIPVNQKQQHMQEQLQAGGRDYPSASTSQQADQLLRQKNSGISDYPRTPGESYQSNQVGVTTNPIKPFLMIDINACKNKQYTEHEIWQIFEQQGIQILHRYPNVGMKFGHVLDAIKDGHKCARTGWNGKGMFIYYVPGQAFPSFTDVAKQEFGTLTPYNEYIAIKNTNGTVSTWVPSINDCFATDWMIV